MKNEQAHENILEEKSKAEELLNAIQDALEDDSACYGTFVNEYGDFTMAIPLSGGQGALDQFMEEQKMKQGLEKLADIIVSQIRTTGKQDIACCFTGRRPKKIAWLADDQDERTHRLQDTLESLIKSLTLSGVSRFVAGNAEGFDTIAAEMVLKSNNELDAMKDLKVLPEDFELAELEIAIPFEGHNARNNRAEHVQLCATLAHVVSDAKKHAQAFFERNEYMVDHSDLVIALLEDDSPDSATGGTARTIAYADEQGKPIIIFYVRWFEDGWPQLNGCSLPPAVVWKNMPSMEG